ncbi:MAG: APC family permease, partial [Myxococcota bacterium]
MRRELGLGDTTAVVIGAIVGVGIFFTPAQVARLAGSEEVALGLWALGGVVAALGAWTFAELGRRYPRAGGQYDVLRDAWGPLPGFLYVFCNLTAIQAGSIAIIAWYCAQNFADAFGATLSPGVNLVAAVVLVAGLTAANVVGVRAGAWVQNVTVVSKLLTLVAVVGLAVVAAPAAPAPAAPVAGERGIALLAGLLPAMFAYGGWQQALWVGGEVKDPERTLPRAILGGVAVVVVVYLGAAWAYFRLLGFEGVAGAGGLAFEAVGA